MQDNRKNIKAITSVKEGLGLVKFTIGVGSESEALSYLVELFKVTRDKITVKEHNALLNKAQVEHHQANLF